MASYLEDYPGTLGNQSSKSGEGPPAEPSIDEVPPIEQVLLYATKIVEDLKEMKKSMKEEVDMERDTLPPQPPQ